MEPSQYCRRKNNVREGRIFTISMIVTVLESERGLHHIKEEKEREHALLSGVIFLLVDLYTIKETPFLVQHKE